MVNSVAGAAGAVGEATEVVSSFATPQILTLMTELIRCTRVSYPRMNFMHQNSDIRELMYSAISTHLLALLHILYILHVVVMLPSKSITLFSFSSHTLYSRLLVPVQVLVKSDKGVAICSDPIALPLNLFYVFGLDNDIGQILASSVRSLDSTSDPTGRSEISPALLQANKSLVDRGPSFFNYFNLLKTFSVMDTINYTLYLVTGRDLLPPGKVRHST